MHETLDIIKIVLIVIVSSVAFLLILKFSADIVKNIKKINNIKRLKSQMNTMAAAATALKTDVAEKGQMGRFKAVYFTYKAEEKTYCKKILLAPSVFNEVIKDDKIYVYYDRHNPENCILKEEWEKSTYKYYIQWDIAYIFCILIFVAVNCFLKII